MSVISTVYDPMGYLQSLTIPLKILFQKVCKLDIDWDDSISKLIVEWKKISKNLKRCEEIVIKCSYFISLDSMHLFTISIICEFDITAKIKERSNCVWKG